MERVPGLGPPHAELAHRQQERHNATTASKPGKPSSKRTAVQFGRALFTSICKAVCRQPGKYQDKRDSLTTAPKDCTADCTKLWTRDRSNDDVKVKRKEETKRRLSLKRT